MFEVGTKEVCENIEVGTIEVCENIKKKGQIARKRAISPFPSMFSSYQQFSPVFAISEIVVYELFQFEIVHYDAVWQWLTSGPYIPTQGPDRAHEISASSHQSAK